MADKPTFADFYAAANSSDRLTAREIHLLGLAVTLTKTCEP